jgi:hypothetical protein
LNEKRIDRFSKGDMSGVQEKSVVFCFVKVVTNLILSLLHASCRFQNYPGRERGGGMLVYSDVHETSPLLPLVVKPTVITPEIS